MHCGAKTYKQAHKIYINLVDATQRLYLIEEHKKNVAGVQIKLPNAHARGRHWHIKKRRKTKRTQGKLAKNQTLFHEFLNVV